MLVIGERKNSNKIISIFWMKWKSEKEKKDRKQKYRKF